ncbi:DDB1- and CUL4-associated factor 8-like [Culicoides brevitarsis]|uniref:DDB1- and CUL4-associated factor 8-like n=1 Tax=Culicoides brevitarsis TaxID=469753 RepID=UPI00307C2B91
MENPNENEKTIETNETCDSKSVKAEKSVSMVVDNEMPGTSSSSNCQNPNEDEEMSSIATTSTTNEPTDTLPKRNGLEFGGQSQVRKKRFSSRNYRNHFESNVNKSSSSDDEEMPELVHPGGHKRQRRHEVRTIAPPPPPEYLEELAAAADNDEGEEGNTDQDDVNDETANSDLSLGSSSSSSDPEIVTFDESSSGDEDIDVSFLNIERPKCSWIALRELFYREHGLSGKGRRTLAGRDPQMFKTRVMGSLNFVERLELMAKLDKHTGCVNGLNFSQDGHLLASGSDDLNVVLWNWASGTVSRVFRSGHHQNVFQTKFYGNGNIQLITTARDGYVRNHDVPSSGGKPYSTTLYKHLGPVHRVATGQMHPYDVLTAGEDGNVINVDMRERKKNRLVNVKNGKRKIILYGVSASPFHNEFCVYGRDKYVRVYDRRSCKTVLKNYFPETLIKDKKPCVLSVTSAVYSHNGSEIIASYADEDIFLFNRRDEEGHFQQRYKGHLNSQTIKNVNFFGSGSEFIVSGSDCGNIFFWDKKTTKIVQWMRGDENGAVNVLECHPEFPFLATSGIDSDIKIWAPSNENPPNLNGLEKCVRKNMRNRSKWLTGEDLFDEDFLRLIMQRRLRTFRGVASDLGLSSEMQDDNDGEEPPIDLNSDSQSNETSDDDETYPRDTFPCSPM